MKSSFLDNLAKRWGYQPISESRAENQSIQISNELGKVSLKDTMSMFEKTKTSNTAKPVNNKQPTGKDTEAFLKTFLSDKGEDIAAGAIDAERVLKFFPELDDAFNLRTASILSGNNFMRHEAKFSLDGNDILSDDEVIKVTEIVENFFKKDYDLSEKLSKWLPDVFKTTGSKALLVMPLSAVNNLRNDKIQGLSAESLVDNLARVKIYSDPVNLATESLADPDVIDNGEFLLETDDALLNNVKLAFESMRLDQISQLSEDEQKKASDYTLSEEGLVTIRESLLKKFKLTGRMKFVENPSVLLAQMVKRQMAVESLNGKISKHLANGVKIDKQKNNEITYAKDKVEELDYLQEEFLDFTEFITTDASPRDIPLIMEFPSEAVIPLIVPGNPTERIGYFIILNSYGEPITLSSSDTEELLKRKVGKENTLIADSYSTIYGSQAFNSLTKGINNDQYFSIYKEISSKFIENNLKNHLAKIGLDNVDFSLYQATAKAMLSNILSKKQTNVLFVPASLMSYLSFKNNEFGVGIPIMQDIIFAQSLKMTYIITRMFSMMDDAVNRREVDITFTDNIPNSHQLMSAIKDHLTKQKVKPFTADPETIQHNLASNCISMRPKNIPGIENFEITNNAVQKNGNKPDESLFDALTKWGQLGTGVPPVVFNQLSENEYAVSILSNNIFYTLRIDKDRKIVIDTMNPFVRNIVRYHPGLLKKIYDALIDNDNSSHPDEKTTGANVANSLNDTTELKSKDDQVSPDFISLVEQIGEPTNLEKDATHYEEDDPDGTTGQVSSLKKIKLEYILRTISLSLPEGKISHHKAIINDIKDYIDIVNSLIDAYFPEDLIPSNSVNADIYQMLRAYARGKMIKEYLTKVHAMEEFNIPELTDINVEDIPETKLFLSNIKRLVEEAEKVVTPPGQDGSENSDMGNDQGGSEYQL